MTNLKDRMEEFKKTFESAWPPYNVPPEKIATMHRATAELKASGIESRALKIGARASDFALFNQDHVEVSSKDLLRQVHPNVFHSNFNLTDAPAKVKSQHEIMQRMNRGKSTTIHNLGPFHFPIP